MNEIALSNNLPQIESEIREEKENVGKSFWEIGRRLNHVKENDLAHGQFLEWLKAIGIERTLAHRMMKVAKELPNVATLQHLGDTALYLLATLPEEEKQEQIEKIEQGESPTVRELQEVRRKSKLKDQAIKALEDELERVKQTKTTEKVIEKEIIPQDYQATQDLNKQLLGKNKDLSDELDSVKRSLRLKEASYEMLEKETSEALALKESIEHLRADKEKLENSVSNIFNLSKLVTKFENFFDEEMAPLRFKTLIQGIGKDAQIEKLRDILTLTENWLDEMNKIVPENGRRIWLPKAPLTNSFWKKLSESRKKWTETLRRQIRSSLTSSCLSKKLTRKSISMMVKLLKSRALFFEKLECLLISTLKNRKHIQVITCSHRRKVSLSA